MHSFKTERDFVVFMGTILLGSYIWVLLHIFRDKQVDFLVCPFRWITNLPCPGCGLTRATIEFLQGNIINAVSINPLVIAVVQTLLITPFLLIFARRKFFSLWVRFETLLEKKTYLFLLFAIILILWVYNIYNSI